MNNHDDGKFLSHLVDETFENMGRNGELESSDGLMKHFMHKSQGLDKKNLFIKEFCALSKHIIELKHLEKNKAYRLCYQTQIVDFPQNWSIFKSLNSLSDGCINITDENPDGLVEIFKMITGDCDSFFLVKSDRSYYLFCGHGEFFTRRFESLALKIEVESDCFKKAA